MTLSQAPVLSIDVIIIGFNEEANLRRCIASVRACCRRVEEQLGAHTRILYVDSQSTDNSMKIAEDEWVKVFSANPDYQSSGNGRTSGFQLTDGDFIQFVDGDTTLFENWLAYATEFLLLHKTAAAVGGIGDAKRKTKKGIISVDNYLWIPQKTHPTRDGGAFLFRRAALEQTGAFEPTIAVGEEYFMLCSLRQKGWEAYRVYEPMLTHWDRHLSNSGLFSQKLRRLVTQSSFKQAAVLRFALLKLKCWDSVDFYRYELLHLFVLAFASLLTASAFFFPEYRIALTAAVLTTLLGYTAFQVFRKQSVFLGLGALLLLSAYAFAIVWVLVFNRPKLALGVQNEIAYQDKVRKINLSRL